MISYEPFWKMMNERGISTYSLQYTYNLNPAIINRLKHNHNFNIEYIDYLCTLFDCEIQDIVCHVNSKF